MSNQGGPQQTSLGGNVLIDQAGDRIVITNPGDNTMLILGILPDGTFGIAYYDDSGTLLRKSNILTDYWYDKSHSNVNVMQSGQLLDNSYGIATAKTGLNVSSGF